jgi:hypothetical protein
MTVFVTRLLLNVVTKSTKTYLTEEGMQHKAIRVFLVYGDLEGPSNVVELTMTQLRKSLPGLTPNTILMTPKSERRFSPPIA